MRTSAVACVTVSHLSYASRLLSAWLVTTFTVERFIGVLYPLRRSLIISVSHARRVILSETVACFLLAGFAPFTIGIVDGRGPGSRLPDCDVLPEMAHIYVVFNVAFVIVGSIVAPVLIIVTLNTAIFRRVRRRATQRDNFDHHSSDDQQHAAPASGSESTRPHAFCLHHHHYHHHQQQQQPHVRQQTGRNRDYNVTVLLLVVSTTFVVLNVPYCVSWFALFFYHVDLDPATSSCAARRLAVSLLAAKYVATVPYCLNYGVNFALYSVCARAFRDQLVRVVWTAPICKLFCHAPAHNELHLAHVGHLPAPAVTPRAPRLRRVVGQHELREIHRQLEGEQVQRCNCRLPDLS